MIDTAEKLYISTIADDAAELARKFGLGLEIADFCTALNMDTDFDERDTQIRCKINGVGRLILHAPFNELYPSAIDPLIVEVAKKRYAQAYGLMHGYGIGRMVAHSGFLPLIYFEEWFVDKSIKFWREFLSDKPDGFRLYLENVLESSPEMLCRIAADVDDERFRLCLDTGHAVYTGCDTPINEWVERMLPFLGHVHLHSNDGKRDSHNAPGDGIIDAAAVISRITEAAPDVTFAIEARDGKTSVEWLISNGFLLI